MTDQLPPAPETSAATADKQVKKRRIPPWRWAWMGFGLAAILWFGSGVYFQKVQQIDEIEYSIGGMEEAEYDRITTNRVRYAFGCKIAAGVLCFAALTYLVSQTDIHRPRKNS